MQGLADGIVSGGSAVLSAMKGAVTGAIDAAKKALGIASPSKVFLRKSECRPAQAWQSASTARANRAQASLENMVDAAGRQRGRGAGQHGGRAGGSGGKSGSGA